MTKRISRINYKGQELLPAKLDIVFKAIFTTGDLDLLASLLSCILEINIQASDVDEKNTELPAAYEAGKLARVDVRVRLADGKHINVEVQLEDEHNIERRTLFYLSKLYTDQMKQGMGFEDICPSIAINILDFIELPKVHQNGNSLKELWMRFLSAESEDELETLSNEHPTIEKAVKKLLYVSVDNSLRYQLDMREKAELDYNAAMSTNYKKGIVEGEKRGEKRGEKKGAKKISLVIAKNLLKKNMAVDDIADATGLSKEEIENVNASG